MNFEAFFHMTFVFWVVLDSPGNIPLFVSLLHSYPPKKQRKIILREMSFALIFMLLFIFFGEAFLKTLRIDTPSLEITGGIIIFLIALRLLFARRKQVNKLEKEPFIVPMAIPLVAGPGILATISLYSGGLASTPYIMLGIVVAWLFSLPFVLMASFIKKLMGENGLVAVEKLFGYLLILTSIQLTLKGLHGTFQH